VLEQWGEDESSLRNADLGALTSDQELQILRLLMDYPAVVEDAARDLAPHLVAFYLKDLAAVFHSYYNSTHFLVDDELARMARLSLIVAVRHVLASGLGLLGVSAPAKM
jgi:arginyl-tRNA synthetase